MSGGARIPLEHARILARALVGALTPACERIEIAGSIRRREPSVGDIELVAIPRVALDLFGAPDPTQPTELSRTLGLLIAAGYLEPRQPRRMGSRYCALEVPAGACVVGPDDVSSITVDAPVPVDLYVVLPPAQWGAILAIRTGPADYSRRLVTSARARGLVCDGGRLRRVWDGGPIPAVERRDAELEDVATPTEREFVESCGLPYVEPWERR